MTRMPSNPPARTTGKARSRRTGRRPFLAALAALVLMVAVAAPPPARALTTETARALIQQVVDDINAIINSGKRGMAMYRDFKGVLRKYGDPPLIARKVIGVDWRRMSASQRKRFTDAFETYLSCTYGARFEEFIGGRIDVIDTRKVRSVYEVISVARLRGQAPFEVRWLVAEKDGRPRMFNMIIEGINITSAQATEIRTMLDRRGGDIEKLIADLPRIACP